MKIQLNAAKRLVAVSDYRTSPYPTIYEWLEDALRDKFTGDDLKQILDKARLNIGERQALEKWMSANRTFVEALEDAIGDDTYIVKGITPPNVVYEAFKKLYNSIF